MKPSHQSDPHGWLGTETLQTRFGDFQFKDGYPVGDAAQRLLDLQKLNRAVEVFSTQLMPVSEIGLREGLRAFGARTPQQVVIWEQLMDARTVLLTANTETVYALAHLNLKADGPTVVEAPPHMLGFLQDGLQRYLADVGPLGADKGKPFRQGGEAAARSERPCHYRPNETVWHCSRHTDGTLTQCQRCQGGPI